MSDSVTCPICGAPAVEIAYGYPSLELFDAADRGEVVLGGCVIGDFSPTHMCTNEGQHEFTALRT